MCHRVEYFCNTAGHQAYAPQKALEIHMKQGHDITLDVSSMPMDIFRRPTRSPGGICNLCFRQTKNLKGHVSRHLQQVALFAVPRADYSDDDDDLKGGLTVFNNARGSRLYEYQDTASENSEGSSDRAFVTENATVEKYYDPSGTSRSA